MTVGRSTGRAVLPFPGGQRADFGEAINMPSLELFSTRFDKRKIPIFQVFFSKSFWVKKIRSLFVLKGWKNQRKREVFENYFWSSFLFYHRSFLKYFFFVICFPNTLFFSHLSYHIYRILFCEENWFVVFEITKCCNLLCVYCYPSCVEVIVEFVLVSFKCRGDWGWSFGLVPYPSSVRWLLFG